jgi:hypothetical protein
MADFTGGAAKAAEQLALDHDADADLDADLKVDREGMVDGGALVIFGEGGAIHVVLQQDRDAVRVLQALQYLEKVGARGQPVERLRDDVGQRDGDGSQRPYRPAALPEQGCDGRLDGAEPAPVEIRAVLDRRLPLGEAMPVQAGRHRVNLCGAAIDADREPGAGTKAIGDGAAADRSLRDAVRFDEPECLQFADRRGHGRLGKGEGGAQLRARHRARTRYQSEDRPGAVGQRPIVRVSVRQCRPHRKSS